MIFNKKGFTLVELLAVITIMAIIGVIAVISIDGMMDEANKTECESIVKSLKSAAKDFVSDARYSDYFEGLKDVGFANVGLMMDGGYFSKKVENPFTKEDVTDKIRDMGVELEFDGNNLKDVYVSDDYIDCANKKFLN